MTKPAADDVAAALGRIAHALEGALGDLAVTGIDAIPRARLAASGAPAAEEVAAAPDAPAGPRGADALAPAAPARPEPVRAERSADEPDGRHRLPARQPPGPLPDAQRQPAGDDAPSLAEVVARRAPAADRLRLVDAEIIGDCRRCKLHRGRTRLVYGVGNPEANLVFVGEGPGAEEDRQGIPFVGRAGQLLTKMIEAMGYARDDVYICNVVKCRPPNNRDPEPDEVEACEPFLKAQLAIVEPQVIVALGRYAAQCLLRTRAPIGRLRGRWATYEGVPCMPTFHPSYLLRSPEKKREAWNDLQLVMARMRGEG